MLHHRRNPQLPQPGVLRGRVPHGLLEVAPMAGLHEKVKATLVFEVLEDANDVGVVKAFQDHELLADLGVRRPDLIGVALADNLADAFSLVWMRSLRPQGCPEDRPERALAEFPADVVHIREPSLVLLEEFLPPPLVALLARGGRPCKRLRDTDLPAREHEAEHTEQQRLELLLANAILAATSMLGEEFHDLLITGAINLELFAQASDRRLEFAET
mmetsp:Transcript_17525/g.48049  ORF Transcript_17525/g.48049 Transcript_17525/m.48049 type:complete len:216 (+) Transcript_17525:1153-1800(+)